MSCSRLSHAVHVFLFAEVLEKEKKEKKNTRDLCMLHCRWLVGISYRVMFRRDPIPAQSTAQTSVLKHVHGAVYICGDSMRPGCQPKADLAKADLGDHSAQAYMGALSSNCRRQSDREKASGIPILPKSYKSVVVRNSWNSRVMANTIFCCLTNFGSEGLPYVLCGKCKTCLP